MVFLVRIVIVYPKCSRKCLNPLFNAKHRRSYRGGGGGEGSLDPPKNLYRGGKFSSMISYMYRQFTYRYYRKFPTKSFKTEHETKRKIAGLLKCIFGV